jgi:biopolymer transport protein ExbD
MAVKLRRHRQSHRFHEMKLLGKEHGRKGGDVVINVTAMVDMMMVLVIFLVMNFNASGEMLFVSKDLKMPAAENGDSVTRVPIVSITCAGSSPETQQCTKGSQLYFEGVVIVPDLRANTDDPNPRIAELEEKLVEQRQKFELVAKREFDNPEEDPTTTVNVQADRFVEFALLKRVLTTCEQAGFGRIRLAVGDARKVEAPPAE